MRRSNGLVYRSMIRTFLTVWIIAYGSVQTTQGQLLYYTFFDDPPFVKGAQNWAGTDGWITNENNDGHGITMLSLLPNEQMAYIGEHTPSGPQTSVGQPINFDPITAGTDVMVVDTLVVFEESSKEQPDDLFMISIANSGGQRLASLLFNNDGLNYGIWRHDGVSDFFLGQGHFFDQLHLFLIEIDCNANTWSAYIDGNVLFLDQQFTNTPFSKDFGYLAYEWQASSAGPGDNRMLVSDVFVWAVPPGEEDFQVDEVGVNSSGMPQIEFTGEPGWDYQVQYSADLKTWHGDLPNSFFTRISEKTQIEYSDPSPPTPPARRWYRVQRSVTP